MSDEFKLPSARRILEGDTATPRQRAESASPPVESPLDDDFRRVLTALRVVLKMGGS